jgi:hypothetical protein
MPAPHATHIVEASADEPRFSIKAGDRFEAYPYVMDPTDKWVLVRRVSDGYEPHCTAYRSQVKIVSRL